jgi:TM2 domain-containing membrane protein YozV
MVLSYEQWLIWTTICLIGNYLVWVAVGMDYIDYRSEFFYWFWNCVGCLGARLVGYSTKRIGYSVNGLTKWDAP